jgi:hypothetical protein
LDGYSAAGKTGTAQKIDPAYESVFVDEVCRVVCRLCAGEQSASRDHRRDRRGPPVRITAAMSQRLCFAKWPNRSCRGWA